MVAIGIRGIKGGVSMGNATLYDVDVYPVTIGAGLSSGFAPGMILVNPRTGDEVFLQTVTAKSAAGILARFIDDKKRDHCYGAESERVRCPRITRGQLLSTKVGDFWP